MGKTKKKTGRIAGISKDQARDTGMAAVLIILLVAHFRHMPGLVPAAIGILVLDMIQPKLFKPLAVLWFGLSHALGAVMSRILLGAIFFLLVTPVALIRRLLGKDSLQLRKWKKGSESVFKVRDHRYAPSDLEQPY